MVYVGGLIVILTIVGIIKRWEVRLVLFTSGALMAILSGKPFGAVTAFSAAMINGGLVPVICTVMGFAYVLKITGCDSHLIHAVVRPMTKLEKILIPATAIVTAMINIALPSAAGVSAAVGAIMIPALIAAGVRPTMAASAVMAGTFGSVMSPGSAHVVFVANLAEMEIMEIVAVVAPKTITAVLIGAVALTVVAFIRKENKGYVGAEGEGVNQGLSGFKVNPLKAIVPVVPLALLILTSPAVGLVKTAITVPQSMFIGIILAGIVSLKNPQEISKNFFSGIGSAYAEVIGIIACAAVFTSGMQSIGLTPALISAMEGSDAVVPVAATFGPMLVAILSGSGDAATLAFNNAITPHAAIFGLEMDSLGTTASLAGALGRTMSPVAGAAIICAGLAKVNPIEITKRNGPGMIIAAVVTMFML
ncbi:MAG: C4-dicarboxylate transporter DcuC [Treponema sp.]|nr:C4-dicarboxylate transporter DcuC [Treponema sp.]